MDRFAVFVDAGYFFAAGAYALTAANTPRRNIQLKSAEALIQALCERAKAQSSTPALLRVYWYDAMMGPRPSLEQSTLAHQAGVKLRLGSLNNAGEQKGVDSLIVTDLIELARNRAISDAILISGDEDLRIAVQLAQTYGVRVNLLAVGDADHNVSPALKMEADSLESLDAVWLAEHLNLTGAKPNSEARPATAQPDAPEGRSLDDIAGDVSATLLDEAGVEAQARLTEHLKTSTTIPPEFDRKLIARTAKAANRKLSADEMRKIRGHFVKTLRARTQDH